MPIGLLNGLFVNQTTIRGALGADADVLTRIAYSSKAYWGYSHEFMEACRDELAVTTQKIENPSFLYFVAMEQAVVQGFYAFEKHSSTQWELEALFVVPEKIGTGLGRLLMQHAKTKAMEFGVKTIIIQGDPNAEGFYVAQGGEKIGEQESGSVAGRQLPLFRIHLSE